MRTALIGQVAPQRPVPFVDNLVRFVWDHELTFIKVDMSRDPNDEAIVAETEEVALAWEGAEQRWRYPADWEGN